MHPYTVKNWLWFAIIVLGLVIAFEANAETVCNFKEQTIITNSEGQQVLSKQRVDVCLDDTVPKVQYGLAPNCGISGKYDPNLPSEAITCQLDDGMWKQYNTFYSMDRYGAKRDLNNFPQPNFSEYRNTNSSGILVGNVIGWFSGLSNDQKRMHVDAITRALEQSANGQGFRWHDGGKSGTATIVATLQTSQGHCKIVHTSLYSGRQQVADSGKACYNNSTSSWAWITDKY